MFGLVNSYFYFTFLEHVENLEMLECQFLYSCDVCGDVAFNSLQDLEQHMKQHELDDQRQIVQSSVPQQGSYNDGQWMHVYLKLLSLSDLLQF